MVDAPASSISPVSCASVDEFAICVATCSICWIASTPAACCIASCSIACVISSPPACSNAPSSIA
jgi:hypothetical protein